MTNLFSEMMTYGAVVEIKMFKLAAAKMGVNFNKLQELAELSLDKALVNLDVLDRDSEVLTNQAWDEEKHQETKF